jgi:hypothetical protein
VSLVDATATQVEEAWQALVEDPWYFEVNDYRTLVESGVCEPERREDVYELVDSRPLTPDDLIREVESCPPLMREFQTQAADAGEAYADDLDEGWVRWIRDEGEAGMPMFHEIIDQWLASPVDWDEYEWFPSDWSGQGKAFKFFSGMDAELLDELGVVIVEGDHPGSDYLAAELRAEIADANRAAERLGLPFRFRREGV